MELEFICKNGWKPFLCVCVCVCVLIFPGVYSQNNIIYEKETILSQKPKTPVCKSALPFQF